MSGPLGSSQWMYSTGAGGFYPYEIGQSLRFNDDDSAYLSRTPASAGDRKTWTWSGWVKRGNLGTQELLNAYQDANNQTLIAFSSDTLIFYTIHGGGAFDYGFQTSGVFRDPSAWYHIVAAFNSVNATAADRVVLYVNGVQQAGSMVFGDIPLNQDGIVNSTNAHSIGRRGGGTNYFDGYMAEVNFIDGSALDPTSFGQFKSGIWVPKAYTGSYGTNGFYLNFSDSAAIGDDLSGNGNDWTPSGLASTDVMLDSPTNNWCTLNSIGNGNKLTSNGNLATGVTGTGALDFSTFVAGSGKWYYEMTFIGSSSPTVFFGISHDKNPDDRVLYRPDGTKDIDTVGSAYGASFTFGDVLGCAFDLDADIIEFFKNGVSQGTISTSAVTKPVNTYTLCAGGADTVFVNYGQDSSFAGNKTRQGNTDANGVGDFYYSPPSGYLALCTANLPAPAIDPAVDDVPADYFNTVLYTGTGAALSVTGVGFQPDWTWIKGRSGATDHALYDAVRGVQEQLESNQTGAETTESTGLTAFGADGFSVGALAQLNTSAATYVAWNWLAGNGTSANINGTISSTVSVNQKAGFSIVSYTGNATAGATIGHGLGVTPNMIIAKNRTGSAQNWQVWQSSMGDNVMQLNLTNAQVASTSNLVFTVADIDASVFKVGTNPSVNGSATDHIAYCFAEVEGFSKFGSYTGNGSADGPFVYCGFRPAFVMVKRTDSTGSWIILDSSRDTYNVADAYLLVDASSAENTLSTLQEDFLSNGFKQRQTGASTNASGGTYIFAAFAESPFKYANAR